MKAVSLFLMALSIVILVGCNGGSSSSGDSGTIDNSRSESEVQDDLEAREKNDPASYLTFRYTQTKNLVGETVLQGKITSSAKIATFKDAVLYITGYSKTGSKVDTWEETVYETFPPGQDIDVKVKLALPKSVKEVEVAIQDASVY
jgi:hypothetical protein